MKKRAIPLPAFTPENACGASPEMCRIMNNVWRVLQCEDTPSNRFRFWCNMFVDTTAVGLFHAVKPLVNDRYWKEFARESAA